MLCVQVCAQTDSGDGLGPVRKRLRSHAPLGPGPQVAQHQDQLGKKDGAGRIIPNMRFLTSARYVVEEKIAVRLGYGNVPKGGSIPLEDVSSPNKKNNNIYRALIEHKLIKRHEIEALASV